MRLPARVIQLLWSSILAMLVGLLGLIAFVHAASLRIDAMSRTIAEDTAPSIVALQRMNVNLGRLRSVLREHLQAPGTPPATALRIAADEEALRENLTWYLSLPVDPGEAEAVEQLRRQVLHFEDFAERIAATTPDTPLHARDQLRRELDATADVVEQALVRATNLNADLAYASTQRLRDVAQHLLPGAVALEALSALAAMIAMSAAVRLSRREVEVTEERLLRQRNTELEAFSGRVAHDLLSPLMTVSLAVGLAEQRLSSQGDERLQGILSRAASSLLRVRQVVSDLLEFARAAAKPPPGAKTEVAPLLDGLVGDLQSRASELGVELRLTSASHRSVPCAEGILSSILSNLVENALRHTGKEADAERRVEVRAVDAGPDVRFEVEDTGPGVPPEDREVIFEPYVHRSTEGSGLGLGLATVKRLAESHGGHVGVESEVGHGALFWVTLPAAA